LYKMNNNLYFKRHHQQCLQSMPKQ